MITEIILLILQFVEDEAKEQENDKEECNRQARS